MSVAQAFNLSADSYDEKRRELVPCFDRFYGNLLDAIPLDTDGVWRVLDLGAGTGLLSGMVAVTYPDSTFTLVDIAPDMLNKAEQRFERLNHKVETVVADLATLDIQESYDLVVSGLAIHHISGKDKKDLFKKVLRCLRPGGAFLNADQVIGTSQGLTDRYHAQWLAQVQSNNITPAEIEAAQDRMKYDQPSTVEDQLTWLRHAGFENVDCWFRDTIFAVFGGTRAP